MVFTTLEDLDYADNLALVSTHIKIGKKRQIDFPPLHPKSGYVSTRPKFKSWHTILTISPHKTW